MLTIVHLIPTLEGGGAERQLTMLAAEQARRGWGVHVALRRGGVYEKRLRSSGVVIHPLGNLKGVHPLLIARIARLMRRIRPDILQTWLPQMDIVGGLASLFSSVPWILSERTSKDAYRHMPIMAWMRSRLGQYAKAVVVNSVEGARYWHHMSAVGGVFTIANAVDVGAIRGATPMSCRGSFDSTPTILSVGRLVNEKAPEILIQAIMCLPERHNVRVLLIGDGPLFQEVHASITEHGLENRVSLLPYQADWWGLLKTAAALISTSRFEGQPNVVLEAMAASCPLIVSDIPAHRAILDERSALIVPRDNPAVLADAIAALLSDPGATRSRAARAFERVAGFTIQATADAYERVYARILYGRSG